MRYPASSGPELFAAALILALAQASPSASGADELARMVPPVLAGTQGIVVPKRSSFIIGLNQQFRLRQQLQQQAANASSSTAASVAPPLNSAPLISTQAPSNIFEANLQWLASRAQADKRRKQQQQQQQGGASSGGQHYQQQQSLYLDRHQQQILAANPNLLNPSSLPTSLLTRSDAQPTGEHNNNNNNQANAAAASLAAGHSLANLTRLALQQQQQQQQQQELNGQQQLYRGFSLIELEVKSDSERRYIQDLYGNLSAAINEQAQNPNALTVSPYVDVDFWSFKYALNDQIDIMVSPKSRAFILGQLSRAKIRHRIKIDDIQSRLDQQLASSGASGASGPGSHLTDSGSGQLSGRGGGAAGGTGGHPSSSREAPLNGRQAAAEPEPLASRPLNDSIFFDNYQRLADINQYVESLVERAGDVARVKVIGRSSQGRYLRVLKLGYDQLDSDGYAAHLNGLQQRAATPGGAASELGQAAAANVARPPPGASTNATLILDTFFRKQESTPKLGSIWLDGGTHAREWISPATVLYIAHRLTANHQKCAAFFGNLRAAVRTAEQEAAALAEQMQRSARRYNQTPSAAGAQVVGAQQLQLQVNSSNNKNKNAHNHHQLPLAASSLEPDLISGINEINTSLLGKPAPPVRARTELERRLEQLAKSPQELAGAFQCDLDLEQLLRRYTFYIMPVLNPDGYEYSHTHNRLWRKTRSTSNHPIYRHFCLGADPNRNYDARHGATGSSTHPCSQTYAGTVPFTEPETRHQSNFVYANRQSMKMYISFHSYSQMILLPFSHSKQLAPDHKDLESVGLAGVKAIEQTHGTVYRVGPSASILYTASGTASDWAYEKAGIKYSYTIELRDTGSYGFLLPRQQILPTGEETFNGLLAMIAQMEKNDNLLQSKSMLNLIVPQAVAGLANITHLAGIAEPEFTRIPLELSDQLKPIAKQRPKPGLENVLEGSSSWPAIDSGPSGVRDRRPGTGGAPGRSGAAAGDSNALGSSESEPFELSGGGELQTAGGHQRLNDDNLIDDSNSDSGYAFEGEGELMEPTRENIVEAAKLSDLRLAGRHDHTRRIVQSAGLTPSGRNFINSPLLKSRAEPEKPKRESSNDLIES